MTKVEVQKIVQSVIQKHAKKSQTMRYQFCIVDKSVRKEGSTWHVSIRPDKQPPRRGEYYDFLNDIETEIRTKRRINVLIVPLTPVNTVTAA